MHIYIIAHKNIQIYILLNYIFVNYKRNEFKVISFDKVFDIK